MSEEKEFNLLHEKWILVMKPDGKVEEVSLVDVFRDAHNFLGLAGELPTQDIAVLRLLLAILHAVFSRYDLEGNPSGVSSPQEAITRWISLWDKGSFPMQIIGDYLLYYQDRFWLFHQKYPFYQVSSLNKYTSYPASKLNGELLESVNKTRLFAQRRGSSKETLLYSEAARWLLHVNAFDDTSAKPKTKGLPKPGIGWVGQLGLIIAMGCNLFETLLLNLVLARDCGNKLWGEEKPVWEKEEVKSDERTEIALPDNLSELLTLQSRRLQLLRNGAYVVGYRALGGDFFPAGNATVEQMTTWRRNKRNERIEPKRFTPSVKMWREFPSLIGLGEKEQPPGIISWLKVVKTKSTFGKESFNFQIAGVLYADEKSSVDEVFWDSLTFNSGILSTYGEDWAVRVIDMVHETEYLVEQLGYFALDLLKSTGYVTSNNRKQEFKRQKAAKKAAQDQAFYRLDIPFRQWLEKIDPTQDSMNNVCNEWRERAKEIVRSLGEELVYLGGPRAMTGRYLKEERAGGNENLYTAPKAYNQFLQRIKVTSIRKEENIVEKESQESQRIC